MPLRLTAPSRGPLRCHGLCDTALLLSPWRLIDVSSNARTSLPRDLRVRWSPKTRNEYVNGSSRLTLCGSRKVTHYCGPAAVDGVASYRRCMSVSAMWISSVTIGAANPRELASFYERLLGWTIATVEDPGPDDPPEAGWAQLRAPADLPGLLTINIEYERQYVRPVWPSQPGKQHITAHFDVPVSDLDAAEQRALAAGAALAKHQPQQGVRVMIDPEGHPFCLFEG